MSAQANSTTPYEHPTVAQLAVSYPGAVNVFTRYNIDYCCGGHRSLEEACHRIGLDPERIRQEIFTSSQKENSSHLHPENWSSGFLIDFIVQNHHNYVKNTIPEIIQLLDKVCAAHGHERVELLNIRERFLCLSEELMQHMEKEEVIVFPAIKRLESSRHEDHPLVHALQPPLLSMEHEHITAGDLIKHIRFLSENYSPPEFACPTFKITYQRLSEFDNDLMRHIHMENNILFPRVKDEQK